MNKKDKNIVVREKLMTQEDVIFTCGIKDVLGRIQEYRVHGHEVTDEMSYCIVENNNMFGKSMNFKKFVPSCLQLYTFYILNNKTTGKIKYEDITIVEPEVEESNPLEKIPGFIGTEKG
jgi:hypothetical protein